MEEEPKKSSWFSMWAVVRHSIVAGAAVGATLFGSYHGSGNEPSFFEQTTYSAITSIVHGHTEQLITIDRRFDRFADKLTRVDQKVDKILERLPECSAATTPSVFTRVANLFNWKNKEEENGTKN